MKRRRVRKILLVVVVGLLLAALLCFYFPQQVLTVDSGTVKAEVMVVLGGGGTERTGRAAELFKAGAAPLVICSGIGDADSNAASLTNSGVPMAAILLEPKSSTTRENAQYTIALLRERHLKSAIIVTTWYHSRRALATFEHYAPDLKFYSRPVYLGYLQNTKTETLKSDVLKRETLEGETPRSEMRKAEIQKGSESNSHQQPLTPSPSPIAGRGWHRTRPGRGGEAAHGAEGGMENGARLCRFRICEAAGLLVALWRVAAVRKSRKQKAKSGNWVC